MNPEQLVLFFKGTPFHTSLSTPPVVLTVLIHKQHVRDRVVQANPIVPVGSDTWSFYMWLCREEAREIRRGFGTPAEDLFGKWKHEAVSRN